VKLYISGPMTGIKDHNFIEFNRVAKLLREKGFDVVNSAELPSSSDMTWEDYMKRDIRLLTTCYGVATLDGWMQSRGSVVECNLATNLQIEVRSWVYWVNINDD
jgi:hypothetical protein